MATDAEITAWAKRLESVFRAAPQGIWFYVASGTAHVLRLDTNGKRKLKRDKITFDDKAVVYTLNGVRIAMDGGDW
jgi:hypothetical protein